MQSTRLFLKHLQIVQEGTYVEARWSAFDMYEIVLPQIRIWKMIALMEYIS